MAAGVAGLAVVAGVALGLTITSTPGTSNPAVSWAVAAPGSAPTPQPGAPSEVARPAPRTGTCPDADALLWAYSAGQGGGAGTDVVSGSVRCAGPYATAEIRDPSLPDQLNALFSVSPVRRLGATTGPVCYVGTGEGGLPPVTATQGAVLGCA